MGFISYNIKEDIQPQIKTEVSIYCKVYFQGALEIGLSMSAAVLSKRCREAQIKQEGNEGRKTHIVISRAL